MAEKVRAYGCTDLIRLDEPLNTPAQIEYLDLLPRRGSASAPPVDAVAEHQGTALLYLFEGTETRAVAPKIAQLQRRLANRSDPAWLGVVRSGSLEIYPIGFHEEAVTAPLETIPEQAPDAPLFFQSLVHGTFPQNDRLRGSDYVFKKIYHLLTQTIEEYVGGTEREPLIQPLDVLSMAGRALFFRFLVDRRIVRKDELKDICPAADGLKDTFAGAEKAAHTSAWLDETFNGDFLRLIDEVATPADDRAARQRAYLQFYKEVERRAGKRFFDYLHAILNGWRNTGGGFQLELDWDDLDFAHIPVGVLSQVYESFSHRADPRTARETSIHYTPRTIARLMVEQAFAAIENPSGAKVLDPACGAGIFLVLAFRRLVSERWRRDGRRPDTRTIQDILYNQLRGFDVSESALRLAALALYITAIEVNGTQYPPKVLRFPENLRDVVLFRFDGERGVSQSSFVLGSLGPSVPAKFDGMFDLVICNPPWTRLREPELQRTEAKAASKAAARAETDAMNEEFTKIGRRALAARGLVELAGRYENPDKNPDLPFLWRATEWAKRDEGIIAFVLPARIFGRTTGQGFKAWRAILHGISITGLINGADLRKTAVWEAMDIPFCLLFARNVLPPGDHRFYYASPLHEPNQNRYGRFRIDPEAAQAISIERVEKQPWVLKALSLGTWRDVEVVSSLLRVFPRTLSEVWKAWNPKMDQASKGYDKSPGPQKPAHFLAKLIDFEPPGEGFSIRFDELRTYFQNYGRESAHRPRTEALYKDPLVIVPQSPGEGSKGPRAFISTSRPLAFSQSYYGYSCAGHPEAGALAALIYLLAHSKLFEYFCLMTSRRTGFDRQTFNKEEFEALPFPDVSKLPASERGALLELARRLEHDHEKPWDELDSFLFHLYGLDEDAALTVNDTLFAAAAYRRQGSAAFQRTTREHRNSFRVELSEALEPYFDVCGEQVLVEEPREKLDKWKQPWFFLSISREQEPVAMDTGLLRKATEEASKISASRIIVRVPGRGGLLLGILNQRRWWTRSRARLCAQHIIRHHLEAFDLA